MAPFSRLERRLRLAQGAFGLPGPPWNLPDGDVVPSWAAAAAWMRCMFPTATRSVEFSATCVPLKFWHRFTMKRQSLFGIDFHVCCLELGGGWQVVGQLPRAIVECLSVIFSPFFFLSNFVFNLARLPALHGAASEETSKGCSWTSGGMMAAVTHSTACGSSPAFMWGEAGLAVSWPAKCVGILVPSDEGRPLPATVSCSFFCWLFVNCPSYLVPLLVLCRMGVCSLMSARSMFGHSSVVCDVVPSGLCGDEPPSMVIPKCRFLTAHCGGAAVY